MEENNNPVSNKPETLGDKLAKVGGFSGQQQTSQTDYSKAEWNNATSYIKNIYAGDNINEIAANNQNWFQSTRNSIGQLITGTAAEIIKTPAYLFSGFDEMENNSFFQMGEWVKQAGENIAPVYISEESKNKVFNPFDSEYNADFIVNLGPTVAMMAIALASEGLATPVISRALSLTGRTSKLANTLRMSAKAGRGVARYDDAARTIATLEKVNPELFAQGITKASSLLNTTKGLTAGFSSRLVESGMEGLQTYQSVTAKLEREGNLTPEEIKKKANDAAYDVYGKNMILGFLDAAQYNALFRGFGSKFGATKIGKALDTTVGKFATQGVSEGLEEGIQFTFSKQAEDKLDGKGENFLATFYNNLDDRDMQKAMVSGALGGAVFQGIGSIAAAKHRRANEILRNNQDVNVKTEDDVSSVQTNAGRREKTVENTIGILEDPNTNSDDLSTIADGELQNALNNQDEQGAQVAATVKNTIDIYTKNLEQQGTDVINANIKQIDQDITAAENNGEIETSNSLKQTKKALENELAIKKQQALLQTKAQIFASAKAEDLRKVAEILNETKNEFDNTDEQEYKVLKSKTNALRSIKAPKAIKDLLLAKYNSQVDKLVTNKDGTKNKLSNPTISREVDFNSAIKNIVESEVALENQNKKIDEFNTEGGKAKFEKEKAKETKEKDRLDKISKAKAAKTPEELRQVGDSKIEKTEAINRRFKELEEDASGELVGRPKTGDSTIQKLRNFYSNKPFTADQEFGKPIDQITDTELQNLIDADKGVAKVDDSIIFSKTEQPATPSGVKPDNSPLDELLNSVPVKKEVNDIKNKRKEELANRVIDDGKTEPTSKDGEFKILGDTNLYRINEVTGRPQIFNNGFWSNTELPPKLFLHNAKKSGWQKTKESINAKYDAKIAKLNAQQSTEGEAVSKPAPVKATIQSEIDDYFDKNKSGTYQTPKGVSKYEKFSSKGWKIHILINKGQEKQAAKDLSKDGLYFKLSFNTIGTWFNGNNTSGATIYVGNKENVVKIIKELQNKDYLGTDSSLLIKPIIGSQKTKAIYGGSNSDISISDNIAIRFDVARTKHGWVGEKNGQTDKKYSEYGLPSYLGKELAGIPYLKSLEKDVNNSIKILESKNSSQDEKRKAIAVIENTYNESIKELEKDFGKDFLGIAELKALKQSTTPKAKPPKESFTESVKPTTVPVKTEDKPAIEVTSKGISNQISSVLTQYIIQYKVLPNGSLQLINGKINGKNKLTAQELIDLGYKVNKNAKVNTLYDLHDGEGQLVKSTNAEELDLDIDYIESGKITTNTKVQLEVDHNNSEINDWNSNSSSKANNFYIQAVVYDENNNRHVIGVIPSTNNNKSEFISELRKSVWEEYSAGNKTGVFKSSTVLDIKEIYGGRVRNNVVSYNKRLSPSAILKRGDTVQLGIGNIVNNIASIETNNEDLELDAREYPDSDSIKGKTFMILKDYAGNNRIVKIFPKSIGVLKEKRNELLSYLAAFDSNNARNIVKFYLDVNNGKKLIPDVNNDLVTRFSNNKISKAYKENTFKEAHKEGAIYVIPKDETAYLNAIKGDINAWYSNPDNYTIFRIDSKQSEIGSDGLSNVTFLDNKLGELNTGKLDFNSVLDKAYTHYAYRYYEFYKLENMPLHIDQNLINTGTYNEDMDQYLETDIEPKNYFHSPQYIFDEKSIFKGDTKANQKGEVKKPSTERIETADVNTVVTPKGVVSDSTAELEVPSTRNFFEEGLKRRNKKYAKVDSNNKTVQNPEEAYKWFNSRLPQVEFEVVESTNKVFQNSGVVGQAIFRAASVYMSENANKGVHYHEAFHAVFNLLANSNDQVALLKEAEKRLGKPNQMLLKDLKKTYPDLTNEEIYNIALEEMLADEFKEYMLTDELKTSLGAKIKRFFRNLFNTIKMYFTNGSLIDQYFYNISNGSFKNVQLKRDYNFATSRYSKVMSDFSINEKTDAMELLTKLLFDSIAAYAEKNSYTLNEKKLYKEVFADGGTSIFSEDNGNSVFSKLLDYYSDNSGANPEKFSLMQSDFEKLVNSLVKDDGTPSNVLGLVISNLKRYGIGIINDSLIKTGTSFDETIEARDEQELDEEYRENWMFETGDINLWSNSSVELRLITNTFPVVKWNSDKSSVDFEEGYLGFNKIYPPLAAYKRIQKLLGSSSTVEHMLSKLNEAATKDAFFFYVQDQFNNNDSFASDLWLYIGQNNKPRYVDVIQDEFKMKILDANDTSNVSVISRQLVNDIKFSSTLIEGGKLNQALANTYRNRLDLLFKEPMANLQEITKLFKEIGFDLTNNIENLELKELNSLYGSRTIKGFLSEIIAGKDPIGLVEEDQEMLVSNKTITETAKLINNTSEEVASDSHRKPTGGNVHEWIQPNYLSKTINKLKSPQFGFEHISFLMQDSYYRYSPMLKSLLESYNTNGKLHKNLNMVILNSARFKGMSSSLDYQNMSPLELNKLNMSLFYNDNQSFFYIPTPVNSDSSAMTLIEIHDNKSSTVSNRKIVDLVFQEITKVANTEKSNIKNRKDKQDIFINFSFLEENKARVLEEWKKIQDEQDEAEIERLTKNFVAVFVQPGINNIIKEEVKELKDRLIKMEIINDENQFNDKFLGKANVDTFLKDYISAHIAYGLDIANIFNNDISYYKGSEDYFKRAKQIWSPGMYLDSTKTRVNYGLKILKDNLVLNNTTLDTIELLVGKEVADLYRFAEVEKTTNEKGEKVVTPKGVNETDAQSFIDLYRFKEIYNGLNRWTDPLERAYRSLLTGQMNLQDVEAVFNVIKPFYFSQHSKESTVLKEIDGKPNPLFNSKNITVYPMQVKNSEQIILPFYGLKEVGGKPNPLFNSKYKEMLEDAGYTFTDTTASFPFDHDTNPRSPIKHTDQFVFDSGVKVGLYGESDSIKDAVRQSMNNEDYRLQMETPAHHVDFKGLFATQIRKHVVNNLDLTGLYEVGNNKMTGQQLYDKYNEVIVKDIQESINELEKEFKTDENGTAFQKVIQKLRTEVINRDLDEQFIEALDYISSAKDETVIPLFHPLHYYRIESLLTSLVTNNTVKQKVNNSVVVANHTSYGFARKPQIVFKEDNSIDYIEAYVPMYNSDLLDFIDPDTRLIDIEKVRQKNPAMLEGIVYRIPNEDKYSTFPIRVIGFLPYEQGGSIILPPEVTKIAGLDFDIDKMYGFFYNWKKTKNWEGIRKYLANKHFDQYGTEILATDPKEFKKLTRQDGLMKDLYNQLTTAELDNFTTYLSKSSLATKEQRDNYKLDIIRSVWRNKNTTKQFLTPGNFDTLTRLSDEIKDKRGVSKEQLPIYSPNTWNTIANRMLVGKALIGIAANGSVAHAIFQHADELTIPKPYLFNNVLHGELNRTDVETAFPIDNPRLIAKNLAELLAAFVDNGKDPRAESVNINNYTVDVAIGMMMAGVDFDTTIYFLAQEPIFNFVEDYLNYGGNVQALEKAKLKWGLTNFKVNKHKPKNHNLKDLRESVGMVNTDPYFTKEFIKDFLYYKKFSKPTSDLIQAIKQGEQGVGPTINDTIFRLELINSDNIDLINGARDFLNNQNLMQNKINSVLDYALDFLVDKAGMIDVRKGIYNDVRNTLSNYKSETLLTVNELTALNQTIFDYLVSEVITPNKELLDTLPKKVLEAKKLYPKYNAFLNKLFVEDNIIFYTGLGSSDNVELGRIRETWDRMLTDPNTAEVANDLILYSFYRSGFRVSPSSFSSLQPVRFYRINTELNNTIKKQLSNLNHNSSIFIDQYIRHNFRNASFVPSVKVEQPGVYISYENDLAVSIKIDNKQTDVALDKNRLEIPFIKHKPIIEGQKTKMKLFELVSSGDVSHYVPAVELGVYKTTGMGKGVVLEEYNYNVPVERSIFNEEVLADYDVIIDAPVTTSITLSSSLMKQLLTINDLSEFQETMRDIAKKEIIITSEQRAELNRYYIELKTPKVESQTNQPTSSVQFYEGDITPDANTIFVFGSNPEGRHGAGAAKLAKTKFGAISGQGEGLQGNAYALPTKDLRVKENKALRSISIDDIVKSITTLYEVAKQNPNKQFKVAYRNTTETSLNGYTGIEMINAFMAAAYEMTYDADGLAAEYFNIPSNIVFSKEWVDTGLFSVVNRKNNDNNNSPLNKCKSS